MTRQAAEAAGGEVASCRSSSSTSTSRRSRILLVTGDRGLAGAFNSQILRAGMRAAGEYEGDGRDVAFYASGPPRRLFAGLPRREVAGAYTGFTDRPAYADAREIAADLMAAYIDGKVDRVDIFYNGYISPLVQEVRRETLLPLQQATILETPRTRTTDDEGTGAPRAGRVRARAPRRSSSASSPTTSRSRSTARCWSRPRPSSARA